MARLGHLDPHPPEVQELQRAFSKTKGTGWMVQAKHSTWALCPHSENQQQVSQPRAWQLSAPWGQTKSHCLHPQAAPGRTRAQNASHRLLATARGLSSRVTAGAQGCYY